MHKSIAALLFSFLAQCPVHAHGSSSSDLSQSDAVWESIKVFEGSPQTVTGDFDCQGMSVGVAQWNIRKSKDSVKAIIAAIPSEELSVLMPQFGKRLTQALASSKDQALSFVRSLQTIDRADSCDSRTRNARWTSEGKIFVNELARALATDKAIKAQRRLRSEIFLSGNNNAEEWAKAVRGQEAVATPREVAYFVDMQNFNGGGLKKFGISPQPLTKEARSACLTQAITYLQTANDDFLLHKKAARKNAALLKPQSLSESDADLFCMSYQVAIKLIAPHARQFRLTVINRRAAILFGSAYYSDRDSSPTKISYVDPR